MSTEPTIPDHVSVEPASEFYFAEYRKLNVVFNGTQRPNDVCEFCVSEGWIKILLKAGRPGWKMSRGRFLTLKLNGTVEPKWKI